MNLLLKNYKYKYVILLTILDILLLFYYILVYTLNISLKQIKKYIKENLNGILHYDKSQLTKNNNPIISIIISTFNGEIYLKPVIRSVQNQNFLNIEIIIVDDASIDNTTKIIKGLMEEDERIILLKNKINRGTLYTKSLGVINAKGKYVMTLDHDNFYANEKVFDKLYNEAEKYNIDLLGFAAINSGISFTNLRKNDYINYFRTSIIKQPYTKNRFLGSNKEQSKPYLCLYFIKANIYKNVIKKLGDEFIKRNIDSHDDTIIMFLLSRNVLSLKHLKAIYYILLKWPKEYSSSLNFQITVKNRERQRKICYSYLTFSEVLLLFTENNEYDKNIAENNFLYWFIQEKQCRNKTEIINDTQRICRLYLDNKSISNNAKKEISYYLYELQKNK